MLEQVWPAKRMVERAQNVPHVLEPLACADSVGEIENAVLGIVWRLGFENFMYGSGR